MLCLSERYYPSEWYPRSVNNWTNEHGVLVFNPAICDLSSGCRTSVLLASAMFWVESDTVLKFQSSVENSLRIDKKSSVKLNLESC